MQHASENGNTALYDVLDMPLSKPLPSSADRQIQRIHKTLGLLNGIVSLVWLNVILFVAVGVFIVILYHIGWLYLIRKFNSYFDYASLIAAACVIVYLIVTVVKFTLKVKQLLHVSAKLINQEI